MTASLKVSWITQGLQTYLVKNSSLLSPPAPNLLVSVLPQESVPEPPTYPAITFDFSVPTVFPSDTCLYLLLTTSLPSVLHLSCAVSILTLEDLFEKIGWVPTEKYYTYQTRLSNIPVRFLFSAPTCSFNSVDSSWLQAFFLPCPTCQAGLMLCNLCILLE